MPTGGAGSGYVPSFRAPVPLDAATQLLPEDRRSLTWSLVVHNTEFLQSLLTLVKPALDSDLPFTIQRRGGTSDLFVQSLKKGGVLFVSARLSCDARFYDAEGREMDVGEEKVVVNYKAIKRALRRMGGNMNLAMYQLRAADSPNLYVRVLEGSKCRKFDLVTCVEDEPAGLPTLKFQFNLYLPVQHLREEVTIMHDVAREHEDNMVVELCSIPGAPASHMLFVLRAQGLAGATAEMCTYVCPAPDLSSAGDPVDNIQARTRSGIDATMATKTTTVFRDNTALLPKLYSGEFKTQDLLKVLTDMRSETYVDLFLGRAAEDTTIGKMPMLLRMSGGPDLCMHFVFPHAVRSSEK